jgi:hypothetical protein
LIFAWPEFEIGSNVLPNNSLKTPGVIRGLTKDGFSLCGRREKRVRFFSHGGALRPKRRRRKFVVIAGEGDACPRCREPMQIREYEDDAAQPIPQPFFIRWFCCLNKACKTTLVMPERYRVSVN